jgi:hypothetical protein
MLPYSIKVLCIFFIITLSLNGETIYVASDGNDTYSGLQKSEPLASLEKALKLAQKMPLKEKRVIISIEAGDYMVTKGHRIRGRLDNKPIWIIGTQQKGKITHFLPKSSSCMTWLTLKNSSGKSSSLLIENLTIDSFCTAISLNGNRDDQKKYNGGNIIRNNTFIHIGSMLKNKYSTAAVRLVNSKHNIIENNRFLGIRNRYKCKLLHAIYLAHFSSHNIIRHNTFTDLCGSVIKFRDRSNDNIVEDNYFYGFENTSAIQEWYCNKNKNRKCTKKLGECPSVRNVLEDNTIITDTRFHNTVMHIQKNPPSLPWCTWDEMQERKILIK